MDNETAYLRKLVYGLAVVLLLVLAGSIFLFFKVQNVESARTRIGFVHSDQLLSQYKPAMAVQQQLQQETADAQRDLEVRYKELQAIDAELAKKSKVLTMEALSPQVERFQRKQNEFLQLQQSLQQQVSKKQADLLAPIFQDIGNFITKYGKDHGYTVILGTPVDGLLIYGDSAADLTETILAELNARVPPTLPVPFTPGTVDTSSHK
jgi:outer membrane protein